MLDETSLSVRGGDSLDSCTCEDVKKCAWSKKMLLDIHRLNLPRNSPTRKKVVRFMKYRVCEGEIGKNSVYCCEGGSYPTRTQVKQLKDEQRITVSRRKAVISNDPVNILKNQIISVDLLEANHS